MWKNVASVEWEDVRESSFYVNVKGMAGSCTLIFSTFNAYTRFTM